MGGGRVEQVRLDLQLLGHLAKRPARMFVRRLGGEAAAFAGAAAEAVGIVRHGG